MENCKWWKELDGTSGYECIHPDNPIEIVDAFSECDYCRMCKLCESKEKKDENELTQYKLGYGKGREDGYKVGRKKGWESGYIQAMEWIVNNAEMFIKQVREKE